MGCGDGELLPSRWRVPFECVDATGLRENVRSKGMAKVGDRCVGILLRYVSDLIFRCNDDHNWTAVYFDTLAPGAGKVHAHIRSIRELADDAQCRHYLGI